MSQRLTHITVLQAAKMFGVLYAMMGLVFIPFFLVMERVSPAPVFPFGMTFIVLLPVFYGCLGFVFAAVGAALYNVIAGWIGGIEFQSSHGMEHL